MSFGSFMPFVSDPRSAQRAPLVVIGLAVLLLLPLAGSGAQAQGAPAVATGPSGVLFPEPFVAEHHLVQSTPDGDRFETQPVTDYYGGSWIVSVHPDGSRVVVDLARREVTGIDPGKGTYWSVTFDRLGDLSDRLVRAESRRPAASDEGAEATGGLDERGSTERASAGQAAPPMELVVQELEGEPRGGAAAVKAGTGGGTGGGTGADNVPMTRAGVRHLRVVAKSEAARPGAGEGAGMEIWLDPTITLRPAAVDALDALAAVLGKGRGPDADAAADTPSVDRYLAAARSRVPGAFAVRTVRTVGRGPAELRTRLEDVTTRLDRIDDFPAKLVAVPEGLRRVPHPLEGMVRFLEDETERDRALAGAKRGQ